MNKWEKELGIKYPECGQCGLCCTVATPSSPSIELLRRAGQGDAYSRDFLNLFEPYESMDELNKKFPDFIQRALNLASKSPKFKSSDQVVFFRCRFVGQNNTCKIYEDRPNLCREYPDTPFLLMHPGCSYESWSKECKEKYKQINEELRALKLIQKTLSAVDHDTSLSGVKFTRNLFVVSPCASWLK